MTPAIEDRRPYEGFGYNENTGVGIESQRLANLLETQFREATVRPVILSGKFETVDALKTIYAECAEKNWDGDGAEAISFEAYREALNFISRLPSMGQMPEIIPSPNGQIGLEWYVKKDYLLVVAISGRHSLTFASLFGSTEATSKTLPFHGAIPSDIIEMLSSLTKGTRKNNFTFSTVSGCSSTRAESCAV